MRDFRLRYSVSLLLLFVTASCLVLGYCGESARRQNAGVRAIRELRGGVYYDSPKTASTAISWIASVLGNDWVYTVDRVGCNGMTDEAMTHLRELSYLDLDDSCISDSGLARIQELTSIRELYLNGTQITDRGLESIVQLESLRVLHLDETNVTDDGVPKLTKLPNLQLLTLRRTEVSPEAANRIRKKMPRCKVISEGERWTPPYVSPNEQRKMISPMTNLRESQ